MPGRFPTAKLALEDGTVFTGRAFGARATRVGELAFNTAMSGYQEILTDPSYHRQIVVLTSAQIGNYGVNNDDDESSGPRCDGLVVRELSGRTSNARADASLHDWMAARGVPGIDEVDTRAITRKLRTQGALRAALSTELLEDEKLIAMARAWPGLVGIDLVREVAPAAAYEWSEPMHELIAPGRIPGGAAGLADERAGTLSAAPHAAQPGAAEGRGAEPPLLPMRRVLVIDCGVKRNILRRLVSAGCRVRVVPAGTPAAEILEQRPDGVLVSNGPGDPEPLAGVIDTLRGLRGRVPTFGICLGHQLLALAYGGQTFKLRYGHRGANQPVRNLATGRVEITSQNHGFAVEPDSIDAGGLLPTHVNLNDGTLEGFTHRDDPVFAVQYHPEASPGPTDAAYLFRLFFDMMSRGRPPTAEDFADAMALSV